MAVKQDILDIYAKEVEGIKEAGLFKGEAPIASPQGARVKLETEEKSSNVRQQLPGLAMTSADRGAKKTYEEKGYGWLPVRFICGTRIITNSWQKRISPSRNG